MKEFSIYISNEKSGFSREITIFAKNVESARSIGEDCCLRSNETIYAVYPTESTPPEEFRR